MATSLVPDRLNRIDGEQVIGNQKEESKRDGEKRESEETRDGEMKESKEEHDGGKRESEETCDGEIRESEEDRDGDEENIMMNAGGDSSEDEDEDTVEDEVELNWDCCQCAHRTENSIEYQRCQYCRHRRCRENCREYPEYEVGIYDGHSNVIENTEAEKVARFPPEDCVQEGPSRAGWELKLFKGNARRISRQFPVELMIPIYMETMDLFDPPRTIRAVWNHTEKYWTYRSWVEINTIPWAWMFNKGCLRREIERREIYHPAPPVGKHDFPFFNYATDTLYLDYGRCGVNEIEQERLLHAMTIAGKALEKHQFNTNNPKLRFLQVTYCPFIVVEDILECFKEVKTLEHVTLKWHDHYELSGVDFNTDLWDVHLAVINGALKMNPWPTYMENHRDYPVTRSEGPFSRGVW